MTNSLAVYGDFDTLQRAAVAMFESGYFQDTKSKAQAIVKVMAGQELGLPPFASMSGIHIVSGKPVIGSNLIATMVENSPVYDYQIKVADNSACVIAWFKNGKPVGESSFTRKEAAEGNVDKQWDKDAKAWKEKATWKAYPSDMLFARAISRGARRFAPGIFGGAPVYTPDEMNVDTDTEGYVIVEAAPVDYEEGEVTEIEPAPSGPLPDDEQVIRETPAGQFFNTVAANLDQPLDAVTARMRELGYKSIPGNPDERLHAYRQLKGAFADAVQDDLFGEAAPVAAGNGAYEEA